MIAVVWMVGAAIAAALVIGSLALVESLRRAQRERAAAVKTAMAAMRALGRAEGTLRNAALNSNTDPETRTSLEVALHDLAEDRAEVEPRIK